MMHHDVFATVRERMGSKGVSKKRYKSHNDNKARRMRKFMAQTELIKLFLWHFINYTQFSEL